MTNFSSYATTLENIVDNYKTLLSVLEEEGNDSVSFAISQIKLDLSNIKVFLSEESLNQGSFHENLKFLKGNYYRMYPTRGGLTDFYVWRYDFDERMNANKPLNTAKEKLTEIYNIIK